MSYSVPVSEPSTISVRPQKIRHENAESFSMGAGTKDMLLAAGAIGVGALGAFFLADYIVKGKYIDKIIAVVPSADDEPEGDVDANIAYQIPFDRTTRVNSYGNTGISAYRGKKAPDRLTAPSTTDEYEFEDPGYNQVFTEDAVYQVE